VAFRIHDRCCERRQPKKVLCANERFAWEDGEDVGARGDERS
jgi:hypothetical protein